MKNNPLDRLLSKMRFGVIRAKDLRPGDVLVVHAIMPLSGDQVKQIQQSLKRAFPDHLSCVVQQGLELGRVRVG